MGVLLDRQEVRTQREREKERPPCCSGCCSGTSRAQRSSMFPGQMCFFLCELDVDSDDQRQACPLAATSSKVHCYKRSNKLLVDLCITTSNKKLLVASLERPPKWLKGIATRVPCSRGSPDPTALAGPGSRAWCKDMPQSICPLIVRCKPA